MVRPQNPDQLELLLKETVAFKPNLLSSRFSVRFSKIKSVRSSSERGAPELLDLHRRASSIACEGETLVDMRCEVVDAEDSVATNVTTVTNITSITNAKVDLNPSASSVCQSFNQC